MKPTAAAAACWAHFSQSVSLGSPRPSVFWRWRNTAGFLCAPPPSARSHVHKARRTCHLRQGLSAADPAPSLPTAGR